MAFLDNSGDIILDAVLTDTGRMRLAKGDGSFKIVKFALGDDEINYTRFDLNHPSGSAYADLELLQTPVLESFTNNTSVMNTRLVTIPRNDLFYLPVIKLNELRTGTERNAEINQFAVAVNQETVTTFTTVQDGIIDGTGAGGRDNFIRIDQGLDTTEISATRALDPFLVETQYILEIDNRLGSIVSDTSTGAIAAPLSFIDDDQIASYVLSLDADPDFVTSNTDTTANQQAIAGPRGTVLKFAVQASLELNSSTFLFDQLGGEGTLSSNNIDFIDTTVRVTGGTTGYRVDVPIRFIRNR